MKVQTFIHNTYCVVFQYMQQLHTMYNVMYFRVPMDREGPKSVPIYIYYLAAQSVSQGAPSKREHGFSLLLY